MSSDEPTREMVPWWRDRALLLPMVSGVLLALGFGLEWAGAGWPATVAHAGSLLAGAATFVPGAVRRLMRGGLGVGLLMTIAAVGAVLLGHVGEAAALAFLFSIAEALEDRALDRARHGLRALLSLIPETARVSRRSGEVMIPAAQIRELDILVVRAGERVATDGVVVAGRSSIDTSAVTGESIPVEVAPGDPVPAGSINGAGSIRIEATADGRDNSLTTIVRLVEQAQAKQGDRARLADRIARPLVPMVLIAATLIVGFGFLVGDPGLWTERALVVLVAASPCALAIAVPVTVISAIGAATRFGVVIKSGAAFERLGSIRTVAFDKTGTLTRNRPDVVDVGTAGIDRDLVLRTAASLEAGSTHPLASAILAAAPDHPTATEVTEDAGHGLGGTVDGAAVRVGSTRWLNPGSLSERAHGMEAEGMTVVVVEVDGTAVGVIGIRDELQPEAVDAIRQLHAAGIDMVMLTGDNTRTARALGARVGIGDVRAELRPQDKAAAIEELSATGPTAMIGDGINDAPALAAADAGIAMGANGSAAAVESADVAFTGTDLRLIPQALAHARRGRRIMTGNIVLSLAIIVVLFPLALFGLLGLAGVVLVHEIAEVIVILNGVRAARDPRVRATAAPRSGARCRRGTSPNGAPAPIPRA
ncbi:heavy metal translocating P-type ATPase [Agromyces marinus]|nr:cation-translocating P-type ATPase [Agromyces marinus]